MNSLFDKIESTLSEIPLPYVSPSLIRNFWNVTDYDELRFQVEDDGSGNLWRYCGRVLERVDKDGSVFFNTKDYGNEEDEHFTTLTFVLLAGKEIDGD